MEDSIKYATICCFMLALLDEVPKEDKGEEARHIRKKCQAYIDKHPQHLALVANGAWEVACSYTQDSPVWNPAITLVSLWNEFVHELRSEADLNPRFGIKLWNRQAASLRCMLNSKGIAKHCVEAINKVMYDNKEVLV